MVMKKNIMGKNLRQSIIRSFGRYVAIMLIIALGAGIFVGLLSTKNDMIVTGQAYMDEQNMFDLRLLSSYGWSKDQLDQISGLTGVETAEGMVILDALGRIGDSDTENVYQLYSLPESINKPYLVGGRLPQSPDECVIDSRYGSDSILGKTFYISEGNSADTQESLNYRQFTIVGYVNSPLFMDLNRGSTSLGNGSVAAFVYLPTAAFETDYYTQIDITIPGHYTIYSDAYNDAMDATAEALKPWLEPLVQERYEQVRTQADKEYTDGLKEFEDGKNEYLKGAEDACKELEKAKQELDAAQTEIETQQKTLADGQKALIDGQKKLDESIQTLALSKTEAYAQLADANAELLNNYKSVNSNLQSLIEGLEQINDGIRQLDTGISQLESGLAQLQLSIERIDTLIAVIDTDITTAQSALESAKESGTLDAEAIAQLEERLASLTASKAEYVQQKQQLSTDLESYTAQLSQLQQQRTELQLQRAELETTRKTLEAALKTIDEGFLELQNRQQQADNEFKAAEAKLQAAQAELDSQTKAMKEGKKALADGIAQLNDGWEEYNQGYQEAIRELSEARLELYKGKQALDEAKNTIDSFTAPDVYALTRNTNVSYLALNNNSDIVAGVSRVFPAFFLLVASLVCITTMTRMVEEERTQIGTLKALGYSNGAIISKYLLYAGSAAILGCGLGVIIGSVAFPYILWQAYSLLLTLKPNLHIVFNIPLCVCVVVVYTLVISLVTWSSCRLTLREVPAELIRPKAPTSGKKILLEYLPFWDRFSFLNKVMLRNIFRYRQRLLMMLVGIGGCTALLVTGYGIGDSIKDIVSYQFEQVTTYDLQVQFSEGLDHDQQQMFLDGLTDDVSNAAFFHQSSVEVDFENVTKSLSLICPQDQVDGFIDLHSDDRALNIPANGEALISIGAAEAMGVKIGDTLQIRNADMDMLQVTVTEIFDNHVQNYVILSPQTLQTQWGELPQYQIAFINVKDGIDPHTVSADVSVMENVLNISVSQDIADQVGSMLDALDAIVVTVVICAGLLAVIVIYNLTNINITERIREIATIKVLGFNAIESAMYVFKENLVLSVVGSGLGLLGGKLLLEFVMSQIKIDMVWFEARLVWSSLLLSVCITVLMAVLVDFLLYFKLEKINMAEALKSVE